MDNSDPIQPQPDDDGDSDLARRLARYRKRVESEGRTRSVKVIDRAIADAGKKSKPRK